MHRLPSHGVCSALATLTAALLLGGCSRTPTVRAAPPPPGQAPHAASGASSPSQPAKGPEDAPAGLLARLPGLCVERLYYRRADLQAGTMGQGYVECVDLSDASPGSRLGSRRLFTWRPAEYIDSYVVSPDGRWAAVLVKSPEQLPNTDVTNIHLTNLENGQSTALTTDWAGYGTPIWSSDSRTLAYVSAERETEGLFPPPPDRPRKLPPWTVYCQSVSGGGRVRLFRQAPSLDAIDGRAGLTWVPDRRTLIYPSVRPRGLFLLSADRHPPVLLSRRVPFYVDLRCRRGWWLGPGTHTARVFSLPADAAALERPATWRSPRVVATLNLPTDTFGLLFCPDGRRVLAQVQRYPTDPEGQYLAVIDPTTHTVRAFGRREPTGEVRWSRDGRYLLWEQRTPRDAGNLSELVAVRADAAPAQPLASADWWRESGVQPTVLVRLTTEWANQFRWVEGK